MPRVPEITVGRVAAVGGAVLLLYGTVRGVVGVVTVAAHEVWYRSDNAFDWIKR